MDLGLLALERQIDSWTGNRSELKRQLRGRIRIGEIGLVTRVLFGLSLVTAAAIILPITSVRAKEIGASSSSKAARPNLSPLSGKAAEIDPRDFDQFAREMKIDVNFKPTSYSRKNPANGNLEYAFTKFKCKGGTTVTLVPLNHMAQKSFYDAADKAVGQAEAAFVEGLRPPGFYGPPSDRDDRLQTPADYEKRTLERLNTINDGLNKYRAKFKKDPESIYDFAVFMPSEFKKEYKKMRVDLWLYDAWGRRFTFNKRPDGSVEIGSLGEDGKGSKPISVVNVASETAKADDTLEKAMASQRARAEKLGAVHQVAYIFKANSKATTRIADVDSGMIQDPTALETRIRNNQFRNIVPMMKMDDQLSGRGYHPKSFAISYGAAHMPKFEQYLTGEKYQCRKTKVDWQVAVESGAGSSALTAEQIATRTSYIESATKRIPELDVNPLGIPKKK